MPFSFGIRVDDNFLRMGQIVEAIPGTYAYTGFHWLLYVVVRPVPRVFWPEKPVDPIGVNSPAGTAAPSRIKEPAIELGAIRLM